MYKNILYILLFFLVISSNFLVPAFAQLDPYAEYLKNLNTYTTSRRSFDESKARFNSFKTIQSKQTVTSDAKNMLQNGRNAIAQYTYYIGQYFDRSKPTNERVKNEILIDLQTHNGFLLSIENVLSETPTFTELNTQSQSLMTHYGYIKNTTNQVLLYLDAVRLYDQIQNHKNLLGKIADLNRTIPDEIQAKTIAQVWIDEAKGLTSKDEEEMLQLIENIYPEVKKDANNKEIRAFESGGLSASASTINQINSNLITRTTKAQETLNIMIEAYEKL